ncbi:transposase family protein [Aquibacillus sp. 3ASR75-11]|uniref:Transposase family protein n=1 Tax=Terrihalobacillus insolitus TaxID=2950438 RepID=A0A9X3WSC3_9BACI|nr:transposase family protein [Terrihalobacillus insolitus]MDC3413823.1 transposase family protein [Terrihalobacillus insolitus]MDC3424530.1 transposase family protein [Terrihalobacillus insolitus]
MNRKEKRELEKEAKYFFELMKNNKHFFKDLNKVLLQVKDPRNQSYITYDTDVLLLAPILKNLFNMKSMRGMTESFNRDECIENVKKILGKKTLVELPHYDTINDFLSALDSKELEKIRTYMIKELLKKRSLEKYRINEKYWGVIIDGTGLFSFDEKHCEHCLRREYRDENGEVKKTVYMHHVLEAKLVVGDMVLSIASEFIENESEDVKKQDCKLKAFYRLAEKLKKIFKRLPICILGDSLYTCEGVFDICEENKWKYMLRFKEGRISSVADEFAKLKLLESDNKLEDICWVNGIAYNQRKLNLIECELDEQDGNKKQFLFITDMNITKRNAKALSHAGKSRWKIENQGFNNQKNVRYYIEHANSHNYTAMKNHYILTQIADIMMQLFEKGTKLLKTIKKTAIKISSDLLESFRRHILTDEDITNMVKPIQIRCT